MKATSIAVVAAALAIPPAVCAQAMVEYGALAKLPARVSTPAVTPRTTAGSPGPKITEVRNTRTHVTGHEIGEAASRPAKPAVFILSNGERLESSQYVLTVNSLRVEQDGKQRTVPLSALNLQATTAANRERGFNLQIPRDKAQITLGF